MEESNTCSACECTETFPLEPQGNDFTSSGQLGFLLIQTMSGCGAFNIERHANERQGEQKQEERMTEKVRQAKKGSGSEPGQPILDRITDQKTKPLVK